VSEVFEAISSFFSREPLLIAIDIADIIIVAYVMYRVLLLIRGTRAMQMGIGLVLVYLVYQVARLAGFITLYRVLDQLLTYVVLIVVVLFQNDIRRALMRVGSRPLFRAGRSARESQVIEEVVKAAQELAEKRIGALIVFERDASLDEFIEHGTPLDAAVSKELLYSIFVPSYANPMHDGAVVIRDGRVWEAGVFLPLTDSKKVDRSFGTRHRAAIGISEETDAVVVVVSEERGNCGLCFNGNIARDLDPNMLRQALLGLFQKRQPKKGPRPDSTGRRTVPPPARTSESPAPATPISQAEET